MARRPEKPENESDRAFSAEQWPPVRPDPGPQTADRPRPDPAAPGLGRRAGGAEREAREAPSIPAPGEETIARAPRRSRTDPPAAGGDDPGRRPKAGPRRRRVA